MDYTQNLHLPQWEKTDRIMMDDFNDAFDKIDAAVAAKGNCRIETGSYTGNGQYGIEHPSTLTFPFAPKEICIMQTNAPNTHIRFYPNAAETYAAYSDTVTQLTVSWSNGGKTLSWYTNLNATAQLNLNGKTYFYTVLG